MKTHPRRLSLARREEAENIISEMKNPGGIEPSNSPWASPVVLVKKKDGSTVIAAAKPAFGLHFAGQGLSKKILIYTIEIVFGDRLISELNGF